MEIIKEAIEYYRWGVEKQDSANVIALDNKGYAFSNCKKHDD